MSRPFTYLATVLLFWLGTTAEVFSQEEDSAALMAEPGQTLYELLLGNLALGAGDHQLAYELLKSAAEKLNNTSVAELAWTAAVRTHSGNQIVEASRIWSTLDPSAQAANDALLTNAISRQNGAEVQRLLDERVEKLGENAAAFIATLTRNLSKENYDLQWLESYLEPFWDRFVSTPDVVIAKAVYKKRIGEDKEACRAALSVLPGNGLVFRPRYTHWFAEHEDFATTAADICWSVMPEKSQRILETVIVANPNSTVARLMHGKILARFGHTDLALQETREAVRLEPDSPMVLFNAGQLAIEAKDLKFARELFNRYIAAGRVKNPQHEWATDDVWLELALIYDQLGEYAAEAQALERYHPKENAADIRIRETAAWLKAGKPDNAEQVLLNAIEADPANKRIYFNARIETLIKSEQVDKAIRILQGLLRESPDNEDLLYHLALIYQQQNQPRDYEATLRRILAINPDNPFACNGLGYHYVLADTRLSEARRLIENAYRQRPLDWHVLDSMAWLCFKEKRYEQAYYFALAAMRGPFHREVVVHMVEILVASGRPKEAQAVYTELKRRLPDDSTILDIGKRLQLTP